jgi:hypothetical protein
MLVRKRSLQRSLEVKVEGRVMNDEELLAHVESEYERAEEHARL